jgi:hypothetical protein
MNIQPRTARENRTADGVMSPGLRMLTGVQCNLDPGSDQTAQRSGRSFVFARVVPTVTKHSSSNKKLLRI